MKPTKQTVYLPINEQSNLTVGAFSAEQDEWNSEVYVNKQESFVFTPEQLNDYTQSVIKQALKTAAENANMLGETQHNNNAPDRTADFVYVVDSNGPDYGYVVNKESITNTFEETFKNFEV